MDSNQNSQLILYQTEDGQTQIQVIMQEETVWLTQKEMADLFQRDQSVISRHVNNVFKEGELDAESNMQKMHIANSDKPVAFYNLDVIISVGYRVKSHLLAYAELQAVEKRPMYMQQWVDKLDEFLRFNEKEVLQHKGKVSRLVMEVKVREELQRYHERQKHLEAGNE
jgi:hypothetical protein